MWKNISLLLGPLSFAVLLMNGDPVLGLAAWMFIWWLTQCIPMAATSLLPIVFIPFISEIDLKTTLSPYSSTIIFLFLGGFILGTAIEKHNLHLRLTYFLLKKLGRNFWGVIIGISLTAFVLSMWMSNTATTIILLPIATTCIEILHHKGISNSRFNKNVLLALAYSANIGGICTIIGTPPNAVLVGMLETQLDIQITFLEWLIMALPIGLIVFAFLIIKLKPSDDQNLTEIQQYANKELSSFDRLNLSQMTILIVLSLAIILWVTKPILSPIIAIPDTIVMLALAISLFIFPLNKPVLTWEQTEKLPWGILLFFGGSLSIGNALKEEGYLTIVSDFIFKSSQNEIILIALLVLFVLFATEFLGNVALISIVIPVVIASAGQLQTDIVDVLIPITLASSGAFMFPMSTPPNAIVFSSGQLKMKDMMKAGIYFNLFYLGILLVFLLIS